MVDESHYFFVEDESDFDEEHPMKYQVPNTDTQEIASIKYPTPSHAFPSKKDFAGTVASSGSLKWVDESTSLNYDKEIPPDHNDTLQIALVTSPLEGWVEVKKNKGKKAHFGDTALSDSHSPHVG